MSIHKLKTYLKTALQLTYTSQHWHKSVVINYIGVISVLIIYWRSFGWGWKLLMLPEAKVTWPRHAIVTFPFFLTSQSWHLLMSAFSSSLRILLAFNTHFSFVFTLVFYLSFTTKEKGKKVKGVAVLVSPTKRAKKASNKRWVTATAVRDLNVSDEGAFPPG